MTTRQSFFEATKLHGSGIWNGIVQWNGYTFGTVRWHDNREWKILEAGTTFDQAKERSFKPIAEFHTQQDLWEYIKEQV